MTINRELKWYKPRMWPASLPRHMWPTARGFYFIAAVALESEVALGLAIPYKATAENTTIYKGSGVVSDPSSWDRKLYGGRGNSWPLVSRIDAAAAVALDFNAALG